MRICTNRNCYTIRGIGVLFFSLVSMMAFSQNVIVLKDGSKSEVFHLQIDSLSRTIKYIYQDSITTIVSFDTIDRLDLDVDSGSPKKYSLHASAKPAVVPLIEQVPYFGLRFAEKVSPLLIDFNVFSLFPGLSPYRYPENFFIEVGVEYQLTEFFAINSSLRYGFTTEDVGTVRQGYVYYEKDEQVLYEVSLNPKLYIWGQSRRALFIGLKWNHGSASYEKTDSYEVIGDQNHPEFGNVVRQESTLETALFNELGLGVGILFNLSERFGISVESYVFRSNRLAYSSTRYGVDPGTGATVTLSNYSYQSGNGAFPTLHLNLNFRLIPKN